MLTPIPCGKVSETIVEAAGIPEDEYEVELW